MSNYRILARPAALWTCLLCLLASQALGVEPGYVHHMQVEDTINGTYDVYIYEGTHEEVYGTVESCGPMQALCDDNQNWAQTTCALLAAIWHDGFEEEVRISAGKNAYYFTGQLAYWFAYYDAGMDPRYCDAVQQQGITSDLALVSPIDTVAYWALIVDASDFEQVDEVQFTHEGVDYTAEFVYGAFNELFSDNPSHCGVNFSDFCAKGAHEADLFASHVIDALDSTLAVDAQGTTDRFHIAYQPAGDKIHVRFDTYDIPQSDGCCRGDTVSRDEPLWWVRFSPRPGGSGNPVCANRDNFKSSEASRSFDPLNGHSFAEGDSQFTSTYNLYPQGENEPFPKPDHDCKNSDYQGMVGLKDDSGSDKREHYTYLASNPLIIDLADFDTPQAMLNTLGGLEGTHSRHLKVIHSRFDAMDGLPPVKFHYKLDYLNELYNDNDGFDKYWYLRITPPGGSTQELPYRNGTDEIIDGVASDPDYCIQEDHRCGQGAYDQSRDHAYVIQPGTSALYLWQLAEADDARPDAQYSIADARDEWYSDGANDFDPAGDPEWFLLTDVVGILFTYTFHNEDDLLAASKFEITHGAAYALAKDFQYTSRSQPLPICRTAMKQVDEKVQKIYSGSSSGCGSDKKTWILPVSKHDTRGTVFTNVWVEVME